MKRWHAVQENERRYGAEVRRKYGDEAMDESNKKLLAMDEATWNTKEELELLIIDALKAAMADGDPAGPLAQRMCQMHGQWISMHWADGAYSKGAHLSLAYGYLADARFTEYYDSRAGEGATQFLVDALVIYCG
ncbi:MAG: TipAS antibiotic-recognition domain-containing protein [Coriobacteriia bacterium]|nr:TipAS antibiotic-recognition domain-containing protein [Coriobacteriia bacterium]